MEEVAGFGFLLKSANGIVGIPDESFVFILFDLVFLPKSMFSNCELIFREAKDIDLLFLKGRSTVSRMISSVDRLGG